MIKAIVTTTINSPTIATKKFADMKDWLLIIAGDKKTPDSEYRILENENNNVIYLSYKDQEDQFPKLSKYIGPNSIRRRNFAILEAYSQKAEIIATIDDDNIPYDDWGKDINLGREIEVDFYNNNDIIFDPLFITNEYHLWHRGFPIEKVYYRNLSEPKKKTIIPLIQANLWDGDPDVDAIARILYRPNVNLKKRNGDTITPYSANGFIVFNSQNTFLHRSVIPFYMVLPHIGRIDDIWGAYLLQFLVNKNKDKFTNLGIMNNNPYIIFSKPTVYQERNQHNLIKDFNEEVYGYKNTLSFLKNIEDWSTFLNNKTKAALNEYFRIMGVDI